MDMSSMTSHIFHTLSNNFPSCIGRMTVKRAKNVKNYQKLTFFVIKSLKVVQSQKFFFKTLQLELLYLSM